MWMSSGNSLAGVSLRTTALLAVGGGSTRHLDLPTRHMGLVTRQLWTRSRLRAAASSSGADSEPGENVDSREIGHFSSMSSEWWNPNGEFAPLHAMNPCRVGFIRDRVVQTFGLPADAIRPLQGLSVLDVGCGGGLLSESLCRLGGTVQGIDASFDAVQVAVAHAQSDRTLRNLQYTHTTAEKLLSVGGPGQFQVVCSLEVVEHVPDPHQFVQTLLRLLQPGGVLILSTLNRTLESFMVAIVGAEYILRLITPGTHTWNKFITPAELTAFLTTPCPQHSSGNDAAGATPLPQASDLHMSGMVFDPLTRRCSLRPDSMGVNYIVSCVKPGEAWCLSLTSSST
eukprot:gb/GEZN01007473.1/.p1 GENE.gb/GEZN01007473.1/~~gb/GEZN01007473.1/.p1  ORF type:complete len:341 (-),score=31.80 gb/GEZN01007473.1/:316-1338(-)